MISRYRFGRLTLAATAATAVFIAGLTGCADEGPTGTVRAPRPASPGLRADVGVPGPSCPSSYLAIDDAKPNKVYLYYPVADDATYPEFGGTSPAHRFDAAELPTYTGTTAQLRGAISNVVAETYCEFNVQVRQTTTAPTTTYARRNTIAIGTDANGPCGSEGWGRAEAVDVGDPTVVDFARVWAGSYNCAAVPGGQLHGANSTLLRWARAIGGTAAHEAGHNYGLSHTDGLALAAGEDPLVHHLMASGSHYSYADRTGYRRHFSDREYSILASNVGLSVKTMWNWDFVNPNAATARRLRLELLSTRPSLSIDQSYTGSRSPWINPAVTGPLGTTTFRGTTYNRYRVEWSVGQAWDFGPSGQVPGGAPFHVGATFLGVDFSAPDPIIVTDARLLDGAGNALALRPRVAGFDAGVPDAADGTLALRFFNFDARPLILRNVVVHELPRLISLDAMVPGGKMVDVMGEPFRPWSEGVRRVADSVVVQRGQEVKLPLARLDQRPHVTQVVTEADCAREDRMHGRDVARCRPGVATDLFPSTAVYVTATLVDPTAVRWDPAEKQFVRGVETQLFYQIAGRRLRDQRQPPPIDTAKSR